MAHFDIKWEAGELSLCQASFSGPFITAASPLSPLGSKIGRSALRDGSPPSTLNSFYAPLPLRVLKVTLARSDLAR